MTPYCANVAGSRDAQQRTSFVEVSDGSQVDGILSKSFEALEILQHWFPCKVIALLCTLQEPVNLTVICQGRHV